MISEKYKDPFGFIILRPSLDKSNAMPFLLHAIADFVFPPTRQFKTAGLPFSTYVSEGSSIKYGAPVQANAPTVYKTKRITNKYKDERGSVEFSKFS